MRFRIVILAILIFIQAFFVGCESKPVSEGPQASENIKQEQNAPESYEITDPAELEALWQEYLYDSIPTVGNSRTFDSAAKIDPLNVAMFCWFKYAGEHGTDQLKLAEEGSYLRLFPLETVLEYAGRYFDLNELDVSQLDESTYDPQRQAFLFNLGSERPRPSYRGINPWGYHLDKVTQNGDGTVTAVLSHDSYLAEGITELTQTYTFGRREDKSLYFISGQREYLNNHLVSITGSHRRFDGITGFEGYWGSLSMLGQTDDGVILAYIPYQDNLNGCLLLTDPDTMTVTKRLDINGYFSSADASMAGSHILIRMEDRYITVDKALLKQEEKPLPDKIAEKIGRETKYNRYGFPDVFFGGYDVSEDGTLFAYADEEGVKLLDTARQTEKLLTKTVPVSGSELLNSYFHGSPRFVSNGQKVISTLIGYESAAGYVLCDLETGETKTFENTSEASSTGHIRCDTGLLEVNVYVPGPDGAEGDYRTEYLDFKTGEVKKIDLPDRGQTGDIRMPDFCYVGEGYAAYLTYRTDGGDNASNLFRLNRLDIKTGKVETEIVTLRAAEPHILGVLKDGRILFWYSLNPSEEGVCITE